MMKKLIGMTFIVLVLLVPTSVRAAQNKAIPCSFASYQELQAFFHNNAHFDNEELIRASQTMHIDSKELLHFRSDLYDDQNGGQWRADRMEDAREVDTVNGSITTQCCWVSNPCCDGTLVLDGVEYGAKQISDTIVAYNVTPYVDIHLICSVAPGQSITNTSTVTTTNTITYNANFTLGFDLFKKLKVGFGFSATTTTTVTTTETYSSTYTFQPICNGHISQNYYVASICDLHKIKYQIAPIYRSWLMVGYDCSRAQQVEMTVLVPHQQAFVVCAD